jgi:hypothetical protein
MHKKLSRKPDVVVYSRHRSVSAEDSSVTLNVAESIMAVSVGESTVNVSVYRRIRGL